MGLGGNKEIRGGAGNGQSPQIKVGKGGECLNVCVLTILPVKKPVTSTCDNNNCEDLHTSKKIVCNDTCLARHGMGGSDFLASRQNVRVKIPYRRYHGKRFVVTYA